MIKREVIGEIRRRLEAGTPAQALIAIQLRNGHWRIAGPVVTQNVVKARHAIRVSRHEVLALR